MTIDHKRSGRFASTLTGAPVAVGRYTLRPVAQLRGWRGRGGEGGVGGAGAIVQLRPVAVEVATAGQPAYTIPITDPDAATLRIFVVAAALIAVVAGLLSLLVGWRSAHV